MELTYIVKSTDESIKQILKNEFNMSDRFILKLKNHKSIFINNVSVFINFKIHSGDVLKIIENFEEDSSNIVSNSDINIASLSFASLDRPVTINVCPPMELLSAFFTSHSSSLIITLIPGEYFITSFLIP